MVAIVSEKNNRNKKNDRYFYVILTKDSAIGEALKHTPQHITLIPPFEADEKDVLRVASKVASKHTRFEVETDGHILFGPRKNIPIVMIQPHESLKSIHLDLLNELALKNIVFQKDNFVGDGFTPHIAIKPFHSELDEIRPIPIDYIAVLHKVKDIKTIIAKYNLGIKK